MLRILQGRPTPASPPAPITAERYIPPEWLVNGTMGKSEKRSLHNDKTSASSTAVSTDASSGKVADISTSSRANRSSGSSGDVRQHSGKPVSRYENHRSNEKRLLETPLSQSQSQSTSLRSTEQHRSASRPGSSRTVFGAGMTARSDTSSRPHRASDSGVIYLKDKSRHTPKTTRTESSTSAPDSAGKRDPSVSPKIPRVPTTDRDWQETDKINITASSTDCPVYLQREVENWPKAHRVAQYYFAKKTGDPSTNVDMAKVNDLLRRTSLISKADEATLGEIMSSEDWLEEQAAALAKFSMTKPYSQSDRTSTTITRPRTVREEEMDSGRISRASHVEEVRRQVADKRHLRELEVQRELKEVLEQEELHHDTREDNARQNYTSAALPRYSGSTSSLAPSESGIRRSVSSSSSKSSGHWSPAFSPLASRAAHGRMQSKWTPDTSETHSTQASSSDLCALNYEDDEQAPLVYFVGHGTGGRRNESKRGRRTSMADIASGDSESYYTAPSWLSDRRSSMARSNRSSGLLYAPHYDRRCRKPNGSVRQRLESIVDGLDLPIGGIDEMVATVDSTAQRPEAKVLLWIDGDNMKVFAQYDEKSEGWDAWREI